MAITQTGLSGRFDIQKYRREGRLYRVYDRIDLAVGETVDYVFTNPVEILLVARDIKLVSGSVEYTAFASGTVNGNGTTMNVNPIDFSLGKPPLSGFRKDVLVSNLGVEVDFDLVRTASQKVSTFSVKTSEEASRLYPPGTYFLRLRNNATDLNINERAYGIVEFEFGERQAPNP